MKEDTTHGDLEINEDLAFQRRSWVVERVGWCLMGVVVIAAVAGLFGPGLPPAARAAGEGVESEIAPIARVGQRVTLEIALTAVGPRGAALWIDRGWLHEVELESIMPEPARMYGDAERLYLGLEGSSHLSIAYRPREWGRARGAVAVGDGRPAHFEQLVLP